MKLTDAYISGEVKVKKDWSDTPTPANAFMTDTEKALLLSLKTVSVASSVAGRLVQPVTVTN